MEQGEAKRLQRVSHAQRHPQVSPAHPRPGHSPIGVRSGPHRSSLLLALRPEVRSVLLQAPPPLGESLVLRFHLAVPRRPLARHLECEEWPLGKLSRGLLEVILSQVP